jgi:hypothetical protein
MTKSSTNKTAAKAAAAPVIPPPAKPDAPAAKTPAASAAIENKANRKIHPSRIKLGETARNIWCVYPEPGTSVETLLDPAYWSHWSEKMRPTDRIEVYPEDGCYFAELIVRFSTRQAAYVAPLRYVELGELALPNVNEFRVKYTGPVHKHAVVRVRDSVMMQGGFDTSEGAMQWLALNSRSLAA